MPLPTPKGNEPQPLFNNRCMDDPTMKKEYLSSPQRFAVCKSQWEKSKMETLRSLKNG